MRVQTEEWRRFIPGNRMYKGKKTLFYNGEIIFSFDIENQEPLIYNWEERWSWEVVIVLPGVRVIHRYTFKECFNIKTVIMADSVTTIEYWAFSHCTNLVDVRLSRNIAYIENSTFYLCKNLVSMFIPPSCRQIGMYAFRGCEKLIMLSVHPNTMLEEDVIVGTALIEKSPFEKLPNGTYPVYDDINGWIKSINNGRKCSLHRICCSTYENEVLPISEAIYEVVKEQGLQMLQVENKIGVTPLQYLAENPYLENIDEMKMLRRYMLEMIT
ncbi:hypothetical protein CTEN210_06471 [Chaetoceros tenuissimus]|uniref:Leucine-rich repeat domain-containing protein n=1 Tax=Chaetoceros tenuissimus TaxID=426638 RepID=A0AAD3CSF0_9STRA|nr:hypothetical protein CTEN210_06471 [Chaetoceros tenuissimus]